MVPLFSNSNLCLLLVVSSPTLSLLLVYLTPSRLSAKNALISFDSFRFPSVEFDSSGMSRSHVQAAKPSELVGK